MGEGMEEGAGEVSVVRMREWAGYVRVKQNS